MEKSEPTLVPEWLRSSGSSSGGGSPFHHLSTSTFHSDNSSLAHNNRNRTSRNDFLNRTYAANSRRGSNSNGARHAYSSFSRSNRDRDRHKEKERLYNGDRWDHDSDHLGNLSVGRIGKDTIRGSHSAVSKKQGDLLDHKGSVDLKNSNNINRYNGNGVLGGGMAGTGVPKAVLDKDFPALRAEGRKVAPGIRRGPSPGFITAVQGGPLGTAGLVNGDGWSSALIEVPRVAGNGSIGSSSIQRNATSGANAGSSTTTIGLNMAEALAQPPARANTPPQSSVTTQKLEELAIKQSRQLIPVTPSMPKSLGLNSSDKLKLKISVRSADINGAAKTSQQQPSFSSGSQFPSCGVHTKSDVPKKFLVLKPVWDNGVSSSLKDTTSPPNSTCTRISSNQSPIASPVASAVLSSPSHPKTSTVDSKAASFTLNTGSVMEKKSSSQAQSRSDFFNLMRKKSSKSAASAVQELGAPIFSQTMDKPVEAFQDVGCSLKSPPVFEDGYEAARNYVDSGPLQKLSNAEGNSVNPKILLYPEEEEAAFLRSMGWDENAGEDECLTEEEINSFFEEYMKLKPSLKLCRDMQLRLMLQAESHASRLSGASSEFGSSGSRSKA